MDSDEAPPTTHIPPALLKRLLAAGSPDRGSVTSASWHPLAAGGLDTDEDVPRYTRRPLVSSRLRTFDGDLVAEDRAIVARGYRVYRMEVHNDDDRGASSDDASSRSPHRDQRRGEGPRHRRRRPAAGSNSNSAHRLHAPAVPACLHPPIVNTSATNLAVAAAMRDARRKHGSTSDSPPPSRGSPFPADAVRGGSPYDTDAAHAISDVERRHVYDAFLSTASDASASGPARGGTSPDPAGGRGLVADAALQRVLDYATDAAEDVAVPEALASKDRSSSAVALPERGSLLADSDDAAEDDTHTVDTYWSNRASDHGHRGPRAPPDRNTAPWVAEVMAAMGRHSDFGDAPIVESARFVHDLALRAHIGVEAAAHYVSRGLVKSPLAELPSS